ncbi:uncharacterized protein LOC106672095 [Cimex lectularius]|uniref:Uncharacterized protein n=1 Tax=Cimex lectularius TaxID=79782 RepID=A0A8I6S6F2_CIMLE|nr:uncharacterized protein LOC106672095 [Cimex lectularius]
MTLDYSMWQQWLYDLFDVDTIYEYFYKKGFDADWAQRKLRKSVSWAFNLEEPFSTILLVTVIYFIAVRVYEMKFIWWRKCYPKKKKKDHKMDLVRWLKFQDYKRRELARKTIELAAQAKLPDIERSRAAWRDSVMMKSLNRKKWLEEEMKKIVTQLRRLQMCNNCYSSCCMDRNVLDRKNR